MALFGILGTKNGTPECHLSDYCFILMQLVNRKPLIIGMLTRSTKPGVALCHLSLFCGIP
jgi:hypothetical protein